MSGVEIPLNTYAYPENECDVLHSDLRSFRRKRAQWQSWLDEDPDHAIWPTLLSMVFRDVSFATIGQLAADNPEGPLTTSLIAEAIIHGHVAQQVLGVRRLTDKGKNRISLHRLIVDVKANVHLLTRENWICFDGIPYDYQAVAADEWKDREAGVVVYWGATQGPKAWSTSEMRHKAFDEIAGISIDNRQRTDVIPKSIIKRLETKLHQSEAMILSEWSHAYLAHAADEIGREKVSDVNITNNRISGAIKDLVRITEFLSGNILGIGGYRFSVMPTPQYDVFQNLEKAVAPTEHQSKAADLWRQKSEDWDHCLDDIDDFIKPSA